MSQDDDEVDRIEGLPVAEAVDVVAEDQERDPEAVRAALEAVAEDGVVSREAADDALAHVSKVVSTPETRTELASIALSEARETAEPVADLDVVQSRLDAFESRLSAVEARTSALGADLRRLVKLASDPDPGALHELGAGIRQLTEDANRAQRAADELSVDIEEFERWVENPDVRVRELEADVDSLESALDDLAEAVEGTLGDGDAPDTAGRSAAADPDPSDGDESPDPSDGPDAGAVWLDATFRHRVTGLLLPDVRAELADLRRMAAREDAGGHGAGDADPGESDAVDDVPPADDHDTGDNRDHRDRLDDLQDRLDDLDGRRAHLGERLDDLARSAWRERYGDRLADFEDALEEFDPPVRWGEVQTAVDRHRSRVDALE